MVETKDQLAVVRVLSSMTMLEPLRMHIYVEIRSTRLRSSQGTATGVVRDVSLLDSQETCEIDRRFVVD